MTAMFRRGATRSGRPSWLFGILSEASVSQAAAGTRSSGTTIGNGSYSFSVSSAGPNGGGATRSGSVTRD